MVGQPEFAAPRVQSDALVFVRLLDLWLDIIQGSIEQRTIIPMPCNGLQVLFSAWSQIGVMSKPRRTNHSNLVAWLVVEISPLVRLFR